MSAVMDDKDSVGLMPDVVREAAEEVANPATVIEAALEAAKSDPGAMLEPAVLDALRAVRIEDPAAYSRYRARAKAANKANRVTELDDLTKPSGEVEANALNRLVTLASERCTLCHDADRAGVAIIEVGIHREVWMVRGSGFAAWLRSEYFNAFEGGVTDSTLTSAIATIEAIGVNRGDEVKVHTRFARDGDGYVADLCDEQWRVIRVDATGYKVLERSPVLFTRNERMRPLPVPREGGDLDRLWRYANVEPAQRPLVVAFLLDAMRPDTPFPVLEIVGEQGSAKSTTHRYLRDLTDPSKVPLRGKPASVEDIYVSAAGNWVVSYENLSGLSAEMQDALCTVSTGGGFSTRRFYTNGEEHVLETKRPVMLNGITAIATRPDLIERTVRVDAPQIAAEARRDEADLAHGWIEDRPLIFGALLSLLAATLKLLPEVQLQERQRMADYEKLGEAMMRVDGHPPGTFSKLYVEAQKQGKERALESFGVASALADLAEEQKKLGQKQFRGTIGQLFQHLGNFGEDRSNWPRSARGLADQLLRLAPALREQGLVVTLGTKSRKGRQVTISWTGMDDTTGSPQKLVPEPPAATETPRAQPVPDQPLRELGEQSASIH